MIVSTILSAGIGSPSLNRPLTQVATGSVKGKLLSDEGPYLGSLVFVNVIYEQPTKSRICRLGCDSVPSRRYGPTRSCTTSSHEPGPCKVLNSFLQHIIIVIFSIFII